ncbi:MAG: DUF3526 domain-containing protein [Isosphaeraceae bacterium]|nr:DUF3526 domain-containing protein [Isosphaeraceae bacterium]
MLLYTILKYELRLLAADRTLAVVVLLLSLSVGYGVSNGFAWTEFQRRTLATAAREEAGRFQELKSRLAAPGSRGVPADQFGSTLGTRFAGLPPGPLAALVIGQSDILPYVTSITTTDHPSLVNDVEIENPTHLLTGRFDLGFVVVTLYPLVILALSYNSLSADKESGTLAQLLSQPVTLRTLLLGKVAARGLVVIGIAVAISVGGVLLTAGVPSGEKLVRLLLWLALVAIYGAFWFTLATLVNALGWSSATNALTLAGSWLLLVAVVPAIANVVVRSTHPMPSRVELTLALRTASDRAHATGPRLSSRFLEAHPELVKGAAEADEFAVQSLAVQEATEQGITEILEDFERQLSRQQSLVDRFRFVSPSIATLEGLQDVAGVGSARYRLYLSQVASFHDHRRDYFRPRILRKEPIEANDLDDLPAFAFEEESLGSVAGRVGTALIGLTLPTLVLAVMSRSVLRRYRIAGY